MILSFQGKDNAAVAAELERATGGSVTSVEGFPGEFNGHKFKLGQEVKLVGLEDYPEFNGELVTITSIRVDGAYGKAYYFEASNPNLASQLNWTYEYRLQCARAGGELVGDS